MCLLPKYSHFNINTTRFSSSGLICLRFQKYILPLEFRKLKIDFNYSLRVCSTKDCFETNVPLYLFTTIPGNFFAMCVFIFHKTEVLTVILRCLTGLNLNWVKSYGLRCSLRPHASSANSQKIATDKWLCNDHTWPFFANYMFIFHKTEIQTVILRCLTSLDLNWYKSYDNKHKKAKNAKD